MPRHDVGVVLHDREHDLVALADAMRRRSRDQVDRLGGVAGEDDLLGAARALRKRAHRLARVLVRLGGRVGEEVQAAMHVGVFVLVGVRRCASSTARGFCAEAPLSR